MRDSVFPITLIAAGAIWLLFTLDWVPSLDWIVTSVVVIVTGAFMLVARMAAIPETRSSSPTPSSSNPE